MAARDIPLIMHESIILLSQLLFGRLAFRLQQLQLRYQLQPLPLVLGRQRGQTSQISLPDFYLFDETGLSFSQFRNLLMLLRKIELKDLKQFCKGKGIKLVH